MRRPTRQEIDEVILDQATALFAQHGFRETSVQRIADAAGYSKTGLLHRFPSKEALWEAVSARCTASVRTIGEDVAELPPGPARDHRVLSLLADLAQPSPGVIALILSAFSRLSAPGDSPLLDEVGDLLFAAFGLPPHLDEADVTRVSRVVGALGALAVAAIALRDHPGDPVREHLVAVSYDALGHHRPATP